MNWKAQKFGIDHNYKKNIMIYMNGIMPLHRGVRKL